MKFKGKGSECSTKLFHRLGYAMLLFEATVKQHVTAAARAGDLATQGTFPASHHVNLIDTGIGNLRGKLLLQLDSQPLLVAEAGKRILIVPFISPDLVINDMIGGPRSARITQKQIVFELVDHFAIDAKRIHDDAIFLKFDKIES